MSNGEILILEDDALIALDIEMTLAEAGHEKLSVHHNQDSALSRLEKTVPAAALLDFNLGKSKTSMEVAEKLRAQGVPFLFLTGYTDSTVSLPDGLSDVKRIVKPFKGQELIEAVSQLISRS